jgi:hypothetical protein
MEVLALAHPVKLIPLVFLSAKRQVCAVPL